MGTEREREKESTCPCQSASNVVDCTSTPRNTGKSKSGAFLTRQSHLSRSHSRRPLHGYFLSVSALQVYIDLRRPRHCRDTLGAAAYGQSAVPFVYTIVWYTTSKYHPSSACRFESEKDRCARPSLIDTFPYSKRNTTKKRIYK